MKVMPMSACPSATHWVTSAPLAQRKALRSIASATPICSNIRARCLPAVPPTATSDTATDRAASSACRNASGVAISGSVAPSRTATPILVRPSGRRLPGTSQASILLKAAVDKMTTSASAPAASFASMVPTGAKSNDVAHPVACENCAAIPLTAPLTARALMILRSDTGVPIPLAFDRASKQVTVLLIQVGGNMLTDADRKKAAQLLLTAERDRKPIVQLSSTWPSITFEDAY